MIDFSNSPLRKKGYGGANGSKLSIIYNNEAYMLKLPNHATRNSKLSYAHSPISEYIGCHIFNLLGIKAQETVLGYYNYNNVKRIVVACKDFVEPGFEFIDFASIKNQIIDSSSNGYGTDIKDILDAINTQSSFDSKVL